jgi:hypothetical protein
MDTKVEHTKNDSQTKYTIIVVAINDAVAATGRSEMLRR